MTKKSTMFAGIFLLFSIIFFMVSMGINRRYFETLAYDSVIFYEIRQVLSILVLFLYGFLFHLLIRRSVSLRFCLLLALPTGAALWCISGLFLLMAGIPYNLPLAGLTQIAILGLTYLFRKIRMAKDSINSHANDLKSFFLFSQWEDALPYFITLLGFIFLCSSGLIYVFVSYDSYFYFTTYGNTLTIVQNLKDIVGDNSYTLTNISQFLPLLNSYTSFWGLDQCFQMQAILTVNMLMCFHSAIRVEFDNKRSWSILFLFTLAASTSFLVASTWILANMYCMLYLFFAFLLVQNFVLDQDGLPISEARILLSLYLTALTLLRKDGIIFVCLFLFYLLLKISGNIIGASCDIKKESKKMFLTIFLPSIFFEAWWLFTVRIVLKATVQRAAFTSIANNANIAFVAAAIVGTCIYLFVLHPIFVRKLPFSESVLFYAGLILLMILLTIRNPDQIIDNVDMTIRNMFLFPSSWGLSGFTLGFLLMFTLLTPMKKFWDEDTFLWLGYLLVNFVSYCAVGKNLWVNWDDSYNRIVLQILPIFVFICGRKIHCLLQSDIPNHSSES